MRGVDDVGKHLGVKDLSVVVGMPVAVDQRTGELRFGEGIVAEPAQARGLDDLRSALADPNAGGPNPAYLLYRDVHRNVDAPTFNRARLRYDLTVTRPGTIGREFIKTAGHVHARSAQGTGYSEIYEVIHGQAVFLLQRSQSGWNAQPAASETWLVLARSGDAIVIPADYAHVTINIGPEPLVVSDLVATAALNRYDSLRENRGAAWYVGPDRCSPTGLEIEANARYAPGPFPWVIANGVSRFRLNRPRIPLYRQAIASIGDFLFLTG